MATNFRRDNQKGLTVNRVNVMINHQKRPFAKHSRSELSASTMLSERFDLKLSHLTWVAKQRNHWASDSKLLFALSALPASSPGCFLWQQRLGGIYCELSKVDVHFLNWLATSNINSPSVRFMGSEVG